MKNYYEILEVSPKASKEIIEKAYKVLAKKYHPDLYTGEDKEKAEEKLKEINIAYKILSDDLLRDQYNNEMNKENEIKTEKKAPKIKNNVSKQSKKSSKDQEEETYNGIIGLTRQTFKTLFDGIKGIKSIDMMALGITILIMAVLGVLLWVLPFTHDWMYNTFIGVFK